MSAPSEEELRKMFPNAAESFIRKNAGVTASHSAIGATGFVPGRNGLGALGQLVDRIDEVVTVPASQPARQLRTVKEENASGATSVPQKREMPSNAPISLLLPYPPTANKYWRSIISKGRVMVLVSSKAKHYKRAIAIIAKARVKTPLVGSLVITLKLYRPRKIGDLSNLIKVLEDALQGVCYEDDNQIVEIHAYRHDEKSHPRVELTIALAEVADSQPLLALEP